MLLALIIAGVVVQTGISLYWMWRARGAEESARHWYTVALRRPRLRHARLTDIRFSPKGASHDRQ